jgi:hypothetical protein
MEEELGLRQARFMFLRSPGDLGSLSPALQKHPSVLVECHV